MSASELSLADYKDYLKQVKDLETLCYQQKKLITNSKEKLSELYEQREYCATHKIDLPTGPTTVGEQIGSAVFTGLVGAVAGIIVGFVANLAVYLLNILFHLLSSVFWLYTKKSPDLLPYLGIGAAAGFIILFLYGIISSGGPAEIHASKIRYAKENTNYINAQKSRKETLDRVNRQIHLLPEVIKKSQGKLYETQEILNKYYNLGIIYPKYRGLIPICTIYEYIESGRCVSLTGPDGAYNLYERELRMNLIIDKLDTVIDKLDSIRKSQYMLYEAIQAGNEQLARLSNAVDNLQSTADSIERNTELSSYYNGITATNAAFMGWLSAYSYDHPNR